MSQRYKGEIPLCFYVARTSAEPDSLWTHDIAKTSDTTISSRVHLPIQRFHLKHICLKGSLFYLKGNLKGNLKSSTTSGLPG